MVRQTPVTGSKSKKEPKSKAKVKLDVSKYFLKNSVSTINLSKTMETKTNEPGAASESLSSASGSKGPLTGSNNMTIASPSLTIPPNQIFQTQTYGNKIKTHMTKNKTVYQIPVKNTYETLSDEEMDEDEATETTENPKTIINDELPKSQNKKPIKPPPIVIHGKIKNSNEFINLLKVDIKKGFEIKYTANNTNLFINDSAEYKKYLDKIKPEADNDFQFHTYTHKEDKTHAFVLRGLDPQTDLEYIKEEFSNQNKIEIINIFKMKNTNGLLLVITDNSITEKYLNKNLKVICYTRINWARHINNKQVIQCRKCQQWGHATSNCSAQTKCLKCSQNHWSRDCTVVVKDDPKTHINIKCPNCDGNHLAMSQDCPVYLKRLELINRSKNKRTELRKPNFIPAPIPKINPWLHNNIQKPATTYSIPDQNNYLHFNRTPIAQTNNPQHLLINNDTDTTNTLTTLMDEFKTLNALVDLNHLLTLVRELNIRMRSCKNVMEQFITFNQFCKEKFNSQNSP